jgi:hypothetical protein
MATVTSGSYQAFSAATGSGSVGVNKFATSASVVIYTVPVGYFLFGTTQFSQNITGGSATLTGGGNGVIYAGPGQSIILSASCGTGSGDGGNASASLVGILFVNT